MLKLRPIRAALVACVAATAACSSDGTSPRAVDTARLRADVEKAGAPFATPVAQSLAALGGAMDNALGGSLVALPAEAIVSAGDDPVSASRRIAARAREVRTFNTADGTADVIPATLQGRTLEYDPALRRYVLGTRTGAPANGTRFVLYAVDPLTKRPVTPLVETGYADLTRTITNSAISARLEAFSGTTSAVKAIDYTASLSGTVTTPQVRITGFASDGTDRLEFAMTTLVELAAGRVTVTNEAAVPTQALATRAQVIVDLVTEPGLRLEGRLAGTGGTVEMAGRVAADGNGTITVRINGEVFATITIRPGADPVVVNAADQPVNAEEAAVILQIFQWFGEADDLYDGLSKPVETAIGL
jgi:hypothetical protein